MASLPHTAREVHTDYAPTDDDLAELQAWSDSFPGIPDRCHDEAPEMPDAVMFDPDELFGSRVRRSMVLAEVAEFLARLRTGHGDHEGGAL